MKTGLYCLLPLLASLQLSSAFTPTKLYSGFGWIGVSHQEQTEKCLLALTKELYPGVNTEKDDGFKQARKDIGDANAAVDDDQHHAEKHMGGESFPHGQHVIEDLRKSVKDFLRMNDITGARMSLGESLHTLQDFYSHSNWVELGNEEPHDQLGKKGGVITALDRSVPTCQDCGPKKHFFSVCYNCTNNLITPKGSDMLTSGYFHGEDYVKPTDVKKCSHGGIFDKSTSMSEGGINKDSISCELSPHSDLHYKAVDLSEKATTIYLRDVMTDLTKAEQDALLGRTQKVVIASSHGGITKPKGDDTPLSKRRSSNDDTTYLLEPLESFFKGAKSTSVDEFHASMKRHARRSLPDFDAISLGMLAALHYVPTGAHLLIHTDSELAGRHDTAVANLAARRRIRISFITADSSHGHHGLAHSSGGHVVHHQAADALTDALTSQDAVTIYSSPVAGKHTVPVDPSVSHLHFAGPDLEILRPDGSLCSGSRDEKNPIRGDWTIRSSGAITVTGRSAIRIDGFALMQKWGRPAHEGYFAVQQQVLAGDSYTAVANFEGVIEKPEFYLTGLASGDKIQLEMVKSVNVTDYFANVTIPAGAAARESYLFSMVSADGALLRTWPVPVKASPISVKISSITIEDWNIAEVKVQIAANESGRYTVASMVNNPAYEIVGVGDDDGAGGQTKQICSLPSGGTKEVVFHVKVPGAEKGSASISVVVKDREGAEVVTSRVLPWAEKNHRGRH